MKKVIDAKGKACPMPVIMAKKENRFRNKILRD